MFAAFLLGVIPAFVEHSFPPSARIGRFVQINEILCESPGYAMEFAAAVANGESSELAKDTVGRQAHREVCGRYIGLAVTANTSVSTSQGVVYQLVAFRFREDNRIGWMAESSIAPPRQSENPL